MLQNDKIGAARHQAELRRWRRGFLAWGGVAGVVALAAGWTALWFAACYAAQSRLDGWFAQEAQHGRTWSCPARRVEGFPARLAIVCDGPSFSGAFDGAQVRARVTRLSAGAFLLNPRRVDVDFVAPLIFEMREGDTRLALAFTRLELELYLSLNGLDRAALRGDELEVHWNHRSRAVDGVAQRVEFGFQRNGENSYEIDLESAGLVFPDLDAFANSPDPAALQAKGRLTGAESALANGSWTERLERWRAARGQLFIDNSTFHKGALELTSSGELGLDEFHRLQGRLEVGEKGADPILLRLGVPPAAVGLANRLSGILRGADKGRLQVRLPLSLHNGRVAIGPLRNVFSLEPLY